MMRSRNGRGRSLSDAVSDTAILHEYATRWTFQAHPGQIPPKDQAWFCYLMRSGRGGGKTRAGAEWVLQRVRDGYRHIALIGQTAADVRDTMVELGPSSIMKIARPEERPIYEPSKRRLTFPNGAVATTFTGEEPDQLRGPAHDSVWADELCLAIGTLIETDRGAIPIERIKPGMRVWTRHGLKKVLHSWCSNPDAEVYQLETNDGRTLIGTWNHPIWVEEKGFTPMSLLSCRDILKVWDKRQLNQVSSGVVIDGGSMEDIIAIEKGDCFTEPYIKQSMEPFQKAWISTIKTKIKQITIFPIWLQSIGENILNNITRVGGIPENTKKSGKKFTKNGGMTASHGWQSAINAVYNLVLQPLIQMCDSVLHLVEQSFTGKIQNTCRNLPVNSVVRNSSQLHLMENNPCSVRDHVSAGILHNTTQGNENIKTASYVGSPFIRPIPGQYVVQKNVDISLNPIVQKVSRCIHKYPVFNLEIEGCHEYYANGILTHNCKFRYPQETWDNMEFGLRLGDNPQVFCTTTPRPIPIIKQLVKDPTTIDVRFSTMQNAENLSPLFLKRVMDKYSGTRLGRQELEGELLDDNPGALWQRDVIENLRVHTVPPLIRIVVGVDPAVTSGDESAETGIITTGLSAAGHIYVLHDASLRGTPNEWARSTVRSFHAYQGDRVIGEVNNGGDLVEVNLRTVDRDIPFQAVHASRGKQIRAEPVAALYEQGKVHHVGTFPMLEDQMVEWMPGEKSPDRMDALVWSIWAVAGLGEEEKYEELIVYDDQDYQISPI